MMGGKAAPGALNDHDYDEMEDEDELAQYPPELVEAAKQLGLNAAQIKELQQ